MLSFLTYVLTHVLAQVTSLFGATLLLNEHGRLPHLPEVGLTVEELIAHHGYPSETHHVQTEDGYILTVHRIPPRAPTEDKGAVLLVPGLLCDASALLINGKRSLSLRLAAAGYDVWILNYRGTTHSRRHIHLDADRDASYWNFSFHEVGFYDVAAAIDFVLKEVGGKKVFYVGHSQGSTSFFALASTKPEYNERVRLVVGLAPIAFLGNMQSPLMRFLAVHKPVIENILTAFKIHEILPHRDLYTQAGQAFCSNDSPYQNICALFASLISGRNERQFNKTLLPVITSSIPAGVSRKLLVHFQQQILSGNFQQFDYGEEENRRRYGNQEAPHYDLKKITAPVALIYGRNDVLDGVEDVDRLAEELPNVVLKHLVEDGGFGHLDFLWAVDLDELVNEHVIAVIGKH